MMTSQAQSYTLVKPSEPAAGRDTAIDFTKGVLVLFMVLYHWLNYFIAPSGQFYNYLRFLTPSFIFISGFMISQVHLRKYGTRSFRLPGRLLSRGFKLLTVYIGLNALIALALPDSFVRRSFAESSLSSTLFSVLTGNIAAEAGQKSAAFNILVPIAYLLLASSLLTLLCRGVKYAFHYACAFLILCILVLRSSGMQSVSLELLMTGILGVVFGYAKRPQITAVAKHPWVLGGIYCVYLAAITVWNVTLPIQVLGVIFTTALIYMAGKSSAGPQIVRDRAILLGKYSLFSYISQIAILQVLRRISWLSQHGVTLLIFSLLAAFVLSVAAVDLMDWAKSNSRMADRLYQLVFA